MKETKTQGNFLSYGPQGERRAAFAIESDRRLFEAARGLLAACLSAYRWLEGAPVAELELVEDVLDENAPIVELGSALRKAGVTL